MAVDSSSLITSELINVHCLFDSVTLGTTSCGWYTCASMHGSYEARNKSSFWGWVRVKQQILLDCIWGYLFKSETSHLRDLNVVWKPHTKPLLLQYIPHAQTDFPHSPANKFLLFRNVLSCSYQPHIVSVFIDIHSWSDVQSPHTLIFLSSAVMVLPLKCSLPPGRCITTAYCLSEGASSNSWMSDCSKGRCQPSEKSTSSICNGPSVFELGASFLWQ